MQTPGTATGSPTNGSATQSAGTATGASTSMATTRTATPDGSCLRAGVRNLAGDVTGLPAPVKQTAASITVAVHSCNAGALIALAKQHRTMMSFGGTTATSTLKLPQTSERRYDTLAVLLSMPATKESVAAHTSYVWPAVAADGNEDDEAAWTAAIKAGLVSRVQATQMRQEQTGYLGFRVRIAANGTWESFVNGD